MSEKVDITIIGAGVVGCALAYELSRKNGVSSDIVVIERNHQVNGENQSSRNSGVIHAGVYYPRSMGPLKASLCVKGNSMLYEFCSRYDVPHKKCGKLIAATDELEKEYLADVYNIAKDNGVPGIKIMEKNRIKDLEPNVKAVSALHVPTSGIIEATSLVNRLHDLAEESEVMFLTGNTVTAIKPIDDMFEIKISSGSGIETFNTSILINSAGLFSDEIARMVNPSSKYKMDPVRGESAKFYSDSRKGLEMNGHNVYPVPFGYLPDGNKLRVSFSEFKKLFEKGQVNKSVGVHLTPAFDYEDGKPVVGNTITVGPAYSAPRNKDDYSHSRDAGYYFSMIKPFFPNIKEDDISLHQTGIRAKLSGHYDFIIERDPLYRNMINLIGIDSPGLTSSLAIAQYTAKLIH
jgi:L-2-hydroxyglutarate oxidase LhgO